MPTIVVEVMPKAELLDPQGKAVAGALARTGRSGFSGVPARSTRSMTKSVSLRSHRPMTAFTRAARSAKCQ